MMLNILRTLMLLTVGVCCHVKAQKFCKQSDDCCVATGKSDGCPANYRFGKDAHFKCQRGRLNQGKCGSCWTFATAGSAADRRCQATGMKQRLSEMDLLCAENGMWWAKGDNNICNGGYSNVAMNYISTHGILPYPNRPYFLGWNGKKKGVMQGFNANKATCNAKIKAGGTKFKLSMSGDQPTEETGIYTYAPIGDITDAFFKKNKWYETSTEKWITTIKQLIYEYGPLPISITLRNSFTHHGQFSKGEIYADRPVNALNEKTWCYRKLQPQYPPWFCNTRKHFSVCQDRTKSCHNIVGGHAMKLVGWGVKNDVKYWIIENSYGKNWGDQGYFKLQMYGSGIKYKEVRVTVDAATSRRLSEEIGPEPVEIEKERLLQEDSEQMMDGAFIEVSADRQDIVELVAAAVGCGNNVSEGIASTLISGQNFSTSTTNYMNISITEDGLECLKDALKVEGVDVDSIAHAESKVVEGISYNVVVGLTISPGAKIGGKTVYNAPATGKVLTLLQIDAFKDLNNTFHFSSRVYPGKLSDFDDPISLPEKSDVSYGMATNSYNKFIIFVGLLMLTVALF
jgi:hypothetical protein